MLLLKSKDEQLHLPFAKNNAKLYPYLIAGNSEGFGLGQTRYVWRLNNTKHCGQTVKTCSIFSNSDQTPQAKNYGSQIRKKHVDTSGWASVVRMHAWNMLDTAGQTNKISPIKHENKKMF